MSDYDFKKDDKGKPIAVWETDPETGERRAMPLSALMEDRENEGYTGLSPDDKARDKKILRAAGWIAHDF